MPTLLLIRHARSTANAGGVLAGRTPGVILDEQGQAQADALAHRLAAVPLTAVVSSPLERCLETAQRALSGSSITPVIDERLTECGYGDWTGRELKTLAEEPLWGVVQHHPSAAAFPGDGGESLREMQTRAVAAVRDWNQRLGDRAVYAMFSHGDVIKSVLADALGLHLDQFQRIVVSPASVSVITYTPARPFVHRMNDTAGDLSIFQPPAEEGDAESDNTSGSSAVSSSDAVVGGPAS